MLLMKSLKLVSKSGIAAPILSQDPLIIFFLSMWKVFLMF